MIDSVKSVKFDSIYEIHLELREDERGFFMRVYDDTLFKKFGLQTNWVQESHSLSTRKGIVRGLHFQFPPHTETKLIRAVRGEVYDVFVDLRKNSPTLGQWGSIKLSAKDNNMIYISRGFAHGFCTLTDNCELIYKMDNYYEASSADVIKWNDPDLGINWPVTSPILSEKDSNAKSFKEFIDSCGGLEI
jgi:dTDP-4-dehydrorhamnose 3,5-epimerase